jgi:hypothetical protein
MRYLTCILLVVGLVFAGCNQDDEVTTPTGGGGGGGGGGGALSANSVFQYSVTNPITSAVSTAIVDGWEVTSSNIASNEIGGEDGIDHYNLGGSVGKYNTDGEWGNELVESVSILFGYKSYNTSSGMDLNEWLESYLTLGSKSYETSSFPNPSDPTMRVEVRYEDGQGNFFSTLGVDNSNSQFELVDIEYIPASGWLPAYVKFYATFDCVTDGGQLEGYLIASITVL